MPAYWANIYKLPFNAVELYQSIYQCINIVIFITSAQILMKYRRSKRKVLFPFSSEINFILKDNIC